MSVIFWTVSTSELSSVLHFAPKLGSQEPFDIKIFTPKGESYQHLQLVASKKGGTSVELSHILMEMLPDKGIRHAQISIEGVDHGGVVMRLISPNGHMITSPLRIITATEPYFMPKTFPKSCNSYMALVNQSDAPKEVGIKLMIPGRAPETVLSLNSRETKLIHLQTEFAELIEIMRKNRSVGYLRVRAKGDEEIAVAMLEHVSTDQGVNFKLVTP